MERADAREILVRLLGALVAGRPPLDLVQSAILFGSYAQGAAEVHDLDLDLELDLDDPRAEALVADPGLDELRRALAAGPEVSLSVNQATSYQAQGFHLAPLWQRGQSLDEALAVLDALERAPLPVQGHHFTLPLFVDRGLAHGDRRLLHGLIECEVIAVDASGAGAPFSGPTLGALRSLGAEEQVKWREPRLTLSRGPRFAELEPALEELGLIWHYLLGDDLPDEEDQ